MTGSFDPETLRSLEETEEVHVETRRDESPPPHRTIIWAVVVDEEVFVRSVRGQKGRPYRELSANPSGALLVGDRLIPVRATPAADGQTTAAVSDAYKDKYERDWPEPTAAMVRPDVLPTTLRLSPV